MRRHCTTGSAAKAGQTHLISAFADLLFDEIIRQNQPFGAGGVIWRFLLLMYLSTALLSMPVRLARLANGHGPLGRLPVGFRAKSTIFLASAEKS